MDEIFINKWREVAFSQKKKNDCFIHEITTKEKSIADPKI